MRIKEVLTLPTNELALVLEGLVCEYEELKNGIISAVDKDRKKMTTISKKIAKITIELQNRGWESVVYGREVKFEPLGNSKKQENLL